MKRRNITKAAQERAVLTPSKQVHQTDDIIHKNLPNKNDDETYDNAKTKIKQPNEEASSQIRSAFPVDSSLDPNLMLLLIPLFIFVGLPLGAFGWYAFKNQIRVEQEMGSALLLTIIVGAIIALISQLSNNGLLRILRIRKTISPEQDPKIIKLQTLQTSDDDDDDDTTIHTFQAEDEVWIQPRVRLLLMSKEKDKTVPLILNEEQRQRIAEQVLPRSLADHYWKRLYSLSRDGDTFEWCLRALVDEHRTLIVIRTTKNEILGGYATVAWKTSAGGLVKTAEGGPGACVFCVSTSCSPEDDDDDNDKTTKNHLKVYQWTGTNRYTQLIDVERQRLAMGAGSSSCNQKNDIYNSNTDTGQYAWSVERNFTVGTTGRCPTFDNDLLCESDRFEILDMEIFGFSVC